jgi:hypothetical protein
MGTQLFVGKVFPDIQKCREFLRDEAVRRNFEYVVLKSDQERLTLRCKDLNCSWRVHISRKVKEGGSAVSVKTLNDTHKCAGVQHLGHKQASAKWIQTRVIDKLRDTPSYGANEIAVDLRRVEGVTVSYSKAWRAKEEVASKIRGSYEEGYKRLREYCHKIREYMPGSHAIVEVTTENRFRRIFIAFAPCLSGFQFCRPLIGLDGTHLKSKYLGVLLCATAVDAEGSLYPLAFGVVNNENDANWLWFLDQLRFALLPFKEDPRTITFLSDRQKGLVEAVNTIFPASFHGFCMRHIAENFRRTFKNLQLVELLWKAAYASTTERFAQYMLSIATISSDASAWIQRTADPIHWANAYFGGQRYGHLTSNIAESFNAWIMEAREQPIQIMFETIRRQLMQIFYVRRERSQKFDRVLVEKAEQVCRENSICARRYRVLPADSAKFEILSGDSANVVNLDRRTCTCCQWQKLGLPCTHACAAILYRRESVEQYTEEVFTSRSYRETYSMVIQPLSDSRSIGVVSPPSAFVYAGSDPAEEPILPPSTRRPPGRPKKKRKKTEELGEEKRIFKCSRCSNVGHSRRTCRAPI